MTTNTTPVIRCELLPNIGNILAYAKSIVKYKMVAIHRIIFLIK